MATPDYDAAYVVLKAGLDASFAAFNANDVQWRSLLDKAYADLLIVLGSSTSDPHHWEFYKYMGDRLLQVAKDRGQFRTTTDGVNWTKVDV